MAWSEERICDEYPRAWDYGPVFPKFFKYFHKHGDIADFSNRIDVADDADDITSAVSSVLKTFGQYRGTQLSA